MHEWLEALTFGLALVAFVIGMSNVIMGFMVPKHVGNPIQQRIEFGFIGVSTLVMCLLMIYLLS